MEKLMSLFITINYSGCIGKSLIAGHIIPEYIRRKNKQDHVKLYEFDQYSKTSSSTLLNSVFVKSSIIKTDEIAYSMFDVLFDSENEDVVLDIGDGSLVDICLKELENLLYPRQMIFVVPYGTSCAENLFNTISSIKLKFENPKILIVINNISNVDNLEDAKNTLYEIYGNEDYQIKPHEKKEEFDQLLGAYIPYNRDLSLCICTEKKSLTDLNVLYDYIKNLSECDAVNFFNAVGLTKKEQIADNYKIVYLQKFKLRTAHNFLKGCTDFYSALEKIEKEISD